MWPTSPPLLTAFMDSTCFILITKNLQYSLFYAREVNHEWYCWELKYRNGPLLDTISFFFQTLGNWMCCGALLTSTSLFISNLCPSCFCSRLGYRFWVAESRSANRLLISIKIYLINMHEISDHNHKCRLRWFGAGRMYLNRSVPIYLSSWAAYFIQQAR